MSEEYFEREAEIYGKTVVANPGINEKREKGLSNIQKLLLIIKRQLKI